jgi:hypothetical protein
MPKVDITLKDPDGIYECIHRNHELSEEDKQYLLDTYRISGDYIDLIYDTETKTLQVERR